jgi:predicted O-linked N-acetylglucosamine transferase (SPINDLY family)
MHQSFGSEAADRDVETVLALEEKVWLVRPDCAVGLDLLRQAMRRLGAHPRLRARMAARARWSADWQLLQDCAGVPPGPMTALYITDDGALHRAAAAREAACVVALAAEEEAIPFGHPSGYPKQPLRVGYMSTDFREHPMPYCTAELFERHDRCRVAATGYSLRASDGSAPRRRVEAAFERFVDLTGATDAQAAALIHADGIDILVDLNGYTKGARCGILARRPAPVQVNFLGFPGTMAADFIDYIIGDRVVFGDGAAEHVTERLVLLPDTYFPYDSRKPTAPSPTRDEAGLPATGFVFCCFNAPYKITPRMFDCWMRLLHAADGAVLWLLDLRTGAAENLRWEAAARGINPARLVFAPRLAPADHVARLSLAGLALDTLPYGAHTTAMDALWAGVPMVSCLGKNFAGRVGASLLNAVGLPELITHDLQAYEALALRLARDADLLARLRRRLANNRTTHPLFDTARFARHLETAYETMWAIHCDGGEPRSFGIVRQTS